MCFFIIFVINSIRSRAAKKNPSFSYPILSFILFFILIILKEHFHSILSNCIFYEFSLDSI